MFSTLSKIAFQRQPTQQTLIYANVFILICECHADVSSWVYDVNIYRLNFHFTQLDQLNKNNMFQKNELCQNCISKKTNFHAVSKFSVRWTQWFEDPVKRFTPDNKITPDSKGCNSPYAIQAQTLQGVSMDQDI